MKSAGPQGSSASLERKTKPQLKGMKGMRKMSTRDQREKETSVLNFEHAMPTFCDATNNPPNTSKDIRLTLRYAPSHPLQSHNQLKTIPFFPSVPIPHKRTPPAEIFLSKLARAIHARKSDISPEVQESPMSMFIPTHASRPEIVTIE